MRGLKQARLARVGRQRMPGRAAAVASLQGWESNPLAPSLQHPLLCVTPGCPGRCKKARVFCTVMHAASSSSVRAVSVLASGFKFPVGFWSRRLWNPGVAAGSSVHVGMAGDTVLGLAHSVNPNEIVQGDSSDCMTLALWCLFICQMFFFFCAFESCNK